MPDTQQVTLPVLPATITVEVNGAPCTISGRPNKAKTRTWYSGSKVVEQTTKDPEKALAKIVVTHDGVTLKAGVPHVSAPSKYADGHANAGKDKPWTGGNWTVTHSGVVLKEDTNGGSHAFTLMVTTTYLGPDSRAITNARGKKPTPGFAVSCKAIPQAEHAPTMEVGEDLSFV